MDFDQYKKDYRDHVSKSHAFAKADADFILEHKADRIREIAARRLGDLKKLRVLDVGCGLGLMDAYFPGTFSDLHGVDVARDTLELAKKNNPGVRYQSYDGRRLPFDDHAFDVTFAVCVVHHVPPAQWSEFFRELKRVTRSGGLAMIFEHNPWNPLTQVVVNRCDLDADAVLINRNRLRKEAGAAGLTRVEGEAILYFPWRGRFFRFLERGLSWLPFGGQYYEVFEA